MGLYRTAERVLFSPKGVDWIYPILTSPLSLLYCSIAGLKAYSRFREKRSYPVKVIAVSNLVAGGSGKTPLVIELSKLFNRVAIVSRGYNRKSRGLVVASISGEIVESVDEVGDEAMLFAKRVGNGTVIVSEDRVAGIEKAIEFGVDAVILDDGYSQHHIEKDEFIIESDSTNRLCLPSGGYRERLWSFKSGYHLIREGRDFQRKVEILNRTDNMVLITAISKPQRLNSFLKAEGLENIERYEFPDHYNFSEDEIAPIIEGYSSILTTEKDSVKLERFGFPLSILKLEIDLKGDIFEKYKSNI
jgi:tetraacyldisaccharide 4'-kinase